MHGRERHPQPAQPADAARRRWSATRGSGPATSTEAIDLFGDRGRRRSSRSHHWPTWGTERIVDYLSQQRDLYAYLHDQTLRLLNQGHTGAEIAEKLELPPALEETWHCRGYYGSVSHNVKAIYQRYMGWFDGNPAHLWPHPPSEASASATSSSWAAPTRCSRRRARSFEDGDLRWVARGASTTSSSPTRTTRRPGSCRPTRLEQLGYGAENATWRNFFLTGRQELREGSLGTPTTTAADDMLGRLTVEQLFDSIAIRIDGPRAWGERIVLNWEVGEEAYVTTLENAVLSYVAGKRDPAADASIAMARSVLDRILLGAAAPMELLASGELRVDGDGAKLGVLLGLLDPPDPDFAIVTP